MRLVAAILPCENIADGFCGLLGEALGEQPCGFMAGFCVAAARCIGFAPDDMADRLEPCIAPNLRELGNRAPAAKHNAIAVVFEGSEHFGKGWQYSIAVIVIGDGSAVTIPIAHKVGRIGNNEVNALAWHSSQCLRGIAVDDLVDRYE